MKYSIIHYRFQLVFCLGCFGAIMKPGPDSRCRGVRRPGCRLSERGSDVPCVHLPGQWVLVERRVGCVCVMEEVDRELILKVMNWWKGEQEDDSPRSRRRQRARRIHGRPPAGSGRWTEAHSHRLKDNVCRLMQMPARQDRQGW